MINLTQISRLKGISVLAAILFNFEVKSTFGFMHFPSSACCCFCCFLSAWSASSNAPFFSSKKSWQDRQPGSPSVITQLQMGQIVLCFASFERPKNRRLCRRSLVTLKISKHNFCIQSTNKNAWIT
jgi:hypothetical protein